MGWQRGRRGRRGGRGRRGWRWGRRRRGWWWQRRGLSQSPQTEQLRTERLPLVHLTEQLALVRTIERLAYGRRHRLDLLQPCFFRSLLRLPAPPRPRQQLLLHTTGALHLHCFLQVGAGRLQLGQPACVQARSWYERRVSCADDPLKGGQAQREHQSSETRLQTLRVANTTLVGTRARASFTKTAAPTKATQTYPTHRAACCHGEAR